MAHPPGTPTPLAQIGRLTQASVRNACPVEEMGDNGGAAVRVGGYRSRVTIICVVIFMATLGACVQLIFLKGGCEVKFGYGFVCLKLIVILCLSLDGTLPPFLCCCRSLEFKH